MAIAQLIRQEFDGGKSLSGIGGVETGRDAAEFLLLGADTVQVVLLQPLTTNLRQQAFRLLSSETSWSILQQTLSGCRHERYVQVQSMTTWYRTRCRSAPA